MLEELQQEYERIFKEPFPIMMCRGCTDEEIIKIIKECIKNKKPVKDRGFDY